MSQHEPTSIALDVRSASWVTGVAEVDIRHGMNAGQLAYRTEDDRLVVEPDALFAWVNGRQS